MDIHTPCSACQEVGEPQGGVGGAPPLSGEELLALIIAQKFLKIDFTSKKKRSQGLRQS